MLMNEKSCHWTDWGGWLDGLWVAEEGTGARNKNDRGRVTTRLSILSFAMHTTGSVSHLHSSGQQEKPHW